jgi:hypothetical protein
MKKRSPACPLRTDLEQSHLWKQLKGRSVNLSSSQDANLSLLDSLDSTTIGLSRIANVVPDRPFLDSVRGSTLHVFI